MREAVSLFIAAILFSALASAQDTNSEHTKKTLEIYTRIIEVETAKNLGNVPEVANYLPMSSLLSGSRGKMSKYCQMAR